MLGDVADILRDRASDGWLVGGSVRDRLSGRYSPDLDVVVADDAAAVARQLAASLHAPWFALSDRYPTYRVLGVDGHLDLTEVRGEDVLDDLGERDFTINAMAVPISAWDSTVGPGQGYATVIPQGAAVLDPFGGATHLREKRLVAVSDHIFADDPLRLMRAPRFCHTLDIKPDDALLPMIRKQASTLATVAVERVVNEMCITLGVGRSAEAVRLWERLGLLEVVLPELAQALPGEEGEHVPRLLASLEALDMMLGDPEGWYPEAEEFLRERLLTPVDGAVSRPVALRLAALTSGLGAGPVSALARRLKLSGALASMLSGVARCSATISERGGQRRPEGLGALLAGRAAPGREAVLYMWEAAPWEPEAVLVDAAKDAVVRADSRDGHAGDSARRLMALAVDRARGRLEPLPVDGEVLMRELGLESGPALGRAIREARLAWESQEATSKSEVLEAARRVAHEG